MAACVCVCVGGGGDTLTEFKTLLPWKIRILFPTDKTDEKSENDFQK